MAECDKVCKYIDLPLQHASNAVLKRMKRPGTRQTLRRAARAASATARPGRRPPHHLHRRLPGRDRGRCRRALRVRRAITRSTTSASSPTPTRKARPRSGCADDVPARIKKARRDRVMGLQKRLVRPAAARRGSASAARVVVDGPSADHELVLRGRLATQAPDIDAGVYLTECDPSSYRGPGDFADGRASSAPADYDLIARPVGSSTSVTARAIILRFEA